MTADRWKIEKAGKVRDGGQAWKLNEQDTAKNETLFDYFLCHFVHLSLTLTVI